MTETTRCPYVKLTNGDFLFSDGTRFVNDINSKKGNNKTENIHITIDRPTINGNQIVDINNGQSVKKFLYRPKNLIEYIGQENAKSLVELNIKKIEQLKPVNFLISGSRGHGKTSLAHIIKNLLNAQIIERIASQIVSSDDIVALVNTINRSEEKNIILFIDEIHSLSPSLCEIFYPLIEDFQLAGRAVKPFILIGATTERHILVKNNAPFVDRFQVQIELQRYSTKDIIEILTQYKTQLYPEYRVTQEFIKEISNNAKLTPRIAISLLEDGIIETDIKTVLKCHRIIYQGLTETDVHILRILIQNEKPIGSKCLSQMIGCNEKDYIESYESYLVEQEFIIRSPRGRIIGAKGKEIYKTIQKRNIYAKE